MAASYFEYLLEHLLGGKLVQDKSTHEKIFGSNGGLSTFSSKIDMAYALGLLGKEAKSDLHKIRKMRNAFAHDHKPLNFSVSPFREHCNLFYYSFPGRIQGEYRHNFVVALKGLFAIIATSGFNSEPIQEYKDMVFDQDIMDAIEAVSKLQDEGKLE